MNDWNQNGKYDSSDQYMDYKMSGGDSGGGSGGSGLGMIGYAIICFALAMELSKLWSGFIVVMLIVFIVAGLKGLF